MLHTCHKALIRAAYHLSALIAINIGHAASPLLLPWTDAAAAAKPIPWGLIVACHMPWDGLRNNRALVLCKMMDMQTYLWPQPAPDWPGALLRSPWLQQLLLLQRVRLKVGPSSAQPLRKTKNALTQRLLHLRKLWDNVF